MRIRRCETHDTDAVLAIYRLGLKDQERYARRVIPREDDGFYEHEWREHVRGA